MLFSPSLEHHHARTAYPNHKPDYFYKKDLLFSGMLLQGIVLLMMPWAETMTHYVSISIMLGWGTAMVYPTFLATIAENTNPLDRAKSLGVFRLWRDLGYAFGAILTGIIADTLGLNASIITIGFLTVASAFIIKLRMTCRIKNEGSHNTITTNILSN